MPKLSNTATPNAAAASRELDELVREFIEFNETGTPPPELFADDVFVDFTMPHWRLQAGDRDGLIALRRGGHPDPSRVDGYRVDSTEKGFVIEWTERWTDKDGMDWYCRGRWPARIGSRTAGSATSPCTARTGDWDRKCVEEHRAGCDVLLRAIAPLWAETAGGYRSRSHG